MKFKLMFCWSALSSYFAQSISSLDPHIFEIVIFHKGTGEDNYVRKVFSNSKNCRLLEYSRFNPRDLATFEKSFSPDLLIVGGWQDRKYRSVLKQSNALRVLAMDNVYRGTLKQKIGIATSRLYLHNKFDCAFVAGSAQLDFAKKLGFQKDRIFKGVYSTKPPHFEFQAKSITGRIDRHVPFLFVGRLVEDKGIPTLIKGYERYRQLSSSPRELHIYGAGELSSLLLGREGVTSFGSISYEQLSVVYQEAIALVLPSNREQFGMVVVEACQHALPVVLSENVGSSKDLLQVNLNGYSFGAGDFESLARIFAKFDEMKIEEYLSFASTSYEMGKAFTPDKFIDSILGMIHLRILSTKVNNIKNCKHT